MLSSHESLRALVSLHSCAKILDYGLEREITGIIKLIIVNCYILLAWTPTKKTGPIFQYQNVDQFFSVDFINLK